jgi:predicted phage baseplate assembly protein
VTLADIEALAMEIPGTQLARASARANLHPDFLCLNAPGMITVIVLPYLPVDRPTPRKELLREVEAYLSSRRVIGTRLEVIGPSYLEVASQARVKACAGVNKAELQRRVVASLDRFFHPLMGGPDGKGWPFGRDVFRSEVLQVINETAGVDHVFSLELTANGGEPQCGNIYLSANELAVAGRHRIEVVGGGLCPE